MGESLDNMPHIEFKRDRRSGNYVPEISYPRSPTRSRHSTGSVDRYSESPTRARASVDVSRLPNLSTFLSAPEQSNFRSGSSAPRHVSDSFAVVQKPIIDESTLPDLLSFRIADPIPTLASRSPGEPSFNSSTPLRAVKSEHEEIELKAEVPENSSSDPKSIPAPEPELPSLDIVIYVARHLFRPTMIWEGTPNLILQLSQVELHRLHYVAQAKRALEINQNVRSVDRVPKLSQEERKTLKKITSDANAAALRKKYWRLTLFLRKSYLRYCLSIDPTLSRHTDVWDKLFPSNSSALYTLTHNHLSAEEQDELDNMRAKCEQMAAEVERWARAFRGTPDQAKAYFDDTWPVTSTWETSVEVLNGFLEDVSRIRNDLVSIFPILAGPPTA